MQKSMHLTSKWAKLDIQGGCRGVQDRDTEEGGSHIVRQVRMRLRGATAAHQPCSNDEAQARTSGDGSVSNRRLHRGGDSWGGVAIDTSLAPLSCTMEGLRSDLGGMAAARVGGSGSSRGELGVGGELGGHGGVGTQWRASN